MNSLKPLALRHALLLPLLPLLLAALCASAVHAEVPPPEVATDRKSVV